MRYLLKTGLLFSIFLCLLSACSQNLNKGSTASKAPNILLIVADDLGYTDLGSYGSEIETPNLDALAKSGVTLTNFHTAPTCSPTRSMLLSGVDNHLSGLGSMSGFMELYAPHLLQRPGYEGHLNFNVISVAELLKDAGYRTYMTGKWHLGSSETTQAAARGFDRSYVLLDGAGGHFDDTGYIITQPKSRYREDGHDVSLPDDFYSTKFYAEKMIGYIKQDHDDSRPFFGYLAFTAPHWPLQAPAESIEKYHGHYDDGYEALFDTRFKRLKKMGLINNHAIAPPLFTGEKSWTELSVKEKQRETRTMEIYAAMIDDMDHYIGRVIDALKEMGEYENTIILFISDNGAEGGKASRIPAIENWYKQCCDNRYENMGKPNSYVFLGPNWARASIGRSSLFKSYTTQGGILSPAFISYPEGQFSTRRYDGFVSVMDVLPTFLDMTQTKYPDSPFKGRDIHPLKGQSMLPMLTNIDRDVHKENHVMGWEMFGHKAIRQGNWKITKISPPIGTGKWGLYNLSEDPAELNDRSQQAPEKFQAMLALWEKYQQENGVASISINPDNL